MAKLYFETPASYQEKIESAIYWEAPKDNSDIVERAGYRTIEQQVKEMQLAGERLQDWREATYPEEIVNVLEPTPVFLSEIEIIDRFRQLQKKREAFRIDQENEAELAKKASEPKLAPEPVLVKMVVEENK